MDVRYCDISNEDGRGSIRDIVQDSEIHHVTFITSKAGARRGDHFHLHTTQTVYVISGRLRALARKDYGQPVESVILVAGWAVVNPPGEHHTLIATEDSEFVVLTTGQRGGDKYESDTYRLREPL